MDLKNINKIFKRLEKKYGWRGWWPTTKTLKKSEPEYHKRFRKNLNQTEKTEILIGVILTQNTAWNNVKKALINLHKNNIYSFLDIINTEKNKIIECIKPSGYFNQKYKKLIEMNNFLEKNNLKTLKNMSVQDLRTKLLSIWGIGKESADSIILYVFNKPIFVIDAYTKRILKRLNYISGTEEYDIIQKIIMDNIHSDVEKYNNYHALIVEHCKNNCKVKPICKNCILEKMCFYEKKNIS